MDIAKNVNTLLEVKQLCKNFGKNQAVRELSFSVKKGTCFGLLGPNGAGKTTSMEMIEGIISPSGGEILYQGQPRTPIFFEKIGIQFQKTSLLNFLTVKETLSCFHKLYKQPTDLHDLIKRCELEPTIKKYNNKLSGGQAQRLMLALALINQPEIVFLDEPATGLDPQARRNLWSIVKSIKEEGKTIIMTTHSMEEAEYLCDEIAIMDQGTLLTQGSPKKLIARYCDSEFISLPITALNGHSLAGLPFQSRIVGEFFEIETHNIRESLRQLEQHNIPLTQISIRSGNLEEVFIRLTGRQLRD
jgi:ABC-2 type transport system ATP-binding protein